MKMANENENQELQILQLLVQFLNRVELKGQEVPAFNAALEYLQQKAAPLVAAAEAGQQQAGPQETVTSALPLAEG
jgi:hypothetical protein